MKAIKTFILIVAAISLAACGKKTAPTTPAPADSTADTTVTAPQMAPAEMEPVAEKMPTCKQVMKVMDDTWEKKLSDSHPVLSECGLTCLEYYTFEDEPCTCYDIFYGKNAIIKKHKNADGWMEFKVVPTGPHAVVLYLGLSTDNYQAAYFSDKSDYEAFLKTIKSSYNWGPGEKQYGMYVANELH